MTRTSVKDMNCSIAQFAEIMGDKWALLIVRDAFVGVKTFSEFEKRLGISKNILTERLAHLVEHDILERVRIRPEIERYVYELTPRGRDLISLGAAIIQWSDKWVFGNKGEPVRMLDKKKGAPIQSIEIMARDGRMLGLEDIVFVPGPGRNKGTFIDR